MVDEDEELLEMRVELARRIEEMADLKLRTEARLRAWWRDAPDEQKVAVWGALEKVYDDPVTELFANLALLAVVMLTHEEISA